MSLIGHGGGRVGKSALRTDSPLTAGWADAATCPTRKSVLPFLYPLSDAPPRVIGPAVRSRACTAALSQNRGSLRLDSRFGSASTELALLLPILSMLLLFAVDFARLYYHYSIVTNCARNGTLYGSDPVAAPESNYATLQAAALADAINLNPQPTVTSTNGSDSSGNPYVEVTVVYPFQTISNYPGLSNPINLTRTVRMRVAPSSPN